MLDRMIRTRIQEVAGARGINSSYELQNALKLSPPVAVNLWHDRVKRYSKEILQTLCAGLECQPGDLLVYEPDKKPSKR
jgi:DNA-binding Xre family transcriptional regulator